MMDVIRDHDEFYLNENRKVNTKENFKFIVKHANKFINSISSPQHHLSILDIGCATGDLLFYLSKTFPQARLVGIDVMPELLERAKNEVPDVTFIRSDILNKKSLPVDKFDVIFMVGIHTIFDDVFQVFDNAISLLKDKGRLYVFSFFNDSDIDTLVKVRPSSTNTSWQLGWNLFSKKSIKDYIKNKGMSCKFIDWEMPIDVPKSHDPLRSWTFKDIQGKRLVINGTGILHTYSLLEIVK